MLEKLKAFFRPENYLAKEALDAQAAALSKAIQYVSMDAADTIAQLQEKRPLPIGKTEFEAWSDRIIEGALIEASIDSQKFALASMLLQLGNNEAFKDDGFFINSLRKSAVNQTAQAMMKDIKDAAEARLKEEKQEQGAVTPPIGAAPEVLRHKEV